MGDEKNLRESLISVFEQLKSQDGKIAEMICDVAALRTVLHENSLETQRRYEEVFDKEQFPSVECDPASADDCGLWLPDRTVLFSQEA